MQPNTMNVMARQICAALAGLVLLASLVSAQTTSVGTIQGRVQNSADGTYLNNARVTVEGTNLTALTNQYGEYFIPGVPAGEARVSVFYSGLPSQSAAIRVSAGQTGVQDFDFSRGTTPGGAVVKLDAFKVAESREMSGADMATNEQRFAPNMKTVLAADTFGDQTENNVAEFLKLMPALSVTYVEDHANSVSIRGMPAHTTIVTTNGNPIASAGSGWSDNSRAAEFEHVSINDVARVEINKSLLPDMPAEGIGGTINLVMKNSFERSRPDFRYRAYVNMNSTLMELGSTPGPGRETSHKIKPGFDFSYINPVTKNFGFTIGATHTAKYVPMYLSTTTWNLNPDPVTGAELPFVASISTQDVPKQIERTSGRISADWRFAPHHVLTVGFSEAYYEEWGMNRRFDVALGATPAVIDRNFVQGRPGVGSTTSRGGGMSIKASTTWQPELKWTHDGPVWKFEAGTSYSHASFNVRSKGFMGSVPFSIGTFNANGVGRVGPTVRFDYSGDYLPKITTVLATGESVNPRGLEHTVLNSATQLDRRSVDTKKNARLFGQRTLDIIVPVTVKLGGDIRESLRDKRQRAPNYTFLGPDGVANSRDDAQPLYGLVDQLYSSVTPPFGNPKFEWGDQYKVYDMIVAHPEWWVRNVATEINSEVANSAYLDETISSGFLRLDTALFSNRLAIATGVRYQRYKVSVETGEQNTLARYLHDDDGAIVLNPTTGQPIVIGGSATDIANQTQIERGNLREMTEGGFHPSINASYRLTDNLYIRTNVASSINYPELNQLFALTTISDLTANPRRVTVTKPLEPWTGKNYDLSLEYYTQNGGSISFAWFRKDISNFIRQRTSNAGTPGAQSALGRLGYEQLIPFNYEVVERYNEGEARLSGWEFAVDERLDRYVPDWARGTRIFFNTSYKSAPRGVAGGDLGAFSQRLMNWGISYRRGPFGTHLKWNHVQQRKQTVFDATATRPGSQTLLDVDVSYQFHPRISFFASASNVMGKQRVSYVFTDQTPDYARARQYQYYGVAIVAGLKGQF